MALNEWPVPSARMRGAAATKARASSIVRGASTSPGVKATVPRYRYDQLMRLGRKVFLPLSLFWVVLVSGWLVFTGHFSGGAA